MGKARKVSRARNRADAATDAGDLLCRIGHGSITLFLDPKVYPIATVHGAAYQFLDRAYVRIERARDGNTEVRLAGKTKLDRAALEALAGEFGNELTNQYIREEVALKTTRVREAVIGRALLGALGTGDELSGLGGELAALGDGSEDPLGIAQDWEVRFGHPADKPKPEPLYASDPGKVAGHAELQSRGIMPTPPLPMPHKNAERDSGDGES
jgi:His-Xaa-Ser system protein HxsD